MESLTLQIEHVNAFGLGVALHDGMRHLVPFVLTGETVLAKPYVRRKSSVLCELLQVITPSPDRVIPPCPHYQSCGGCNLQHISYQTELKMKQKWMQQLLGSLETALILPIIASPKDYHYRNRITLHTDGQHTGFYRRGSHDIIEIHECKIASDALNIKIKSAIASKSESSFELREDNSSSFLQINSHLNTHLLNTVKTFATGHKTQRVLELYAGQGNLSFALTEVSREVLAVEGNVDALKRAEEERVQQGNKKIRFVLGDVFKIVHKLREDYEKFDLVVCDPPRGGLGAVRELLFDLAPKKIIYVSCDPSALSADLERLSQKGYDVHRVQPLDMFPQTHHTEVVVEMLKR